MTRWYGPEDVPAELPDHGMTVDEIALALEGLRLWLVEWGERERTEAAA